MTSIVHDKYAREVVSLVVLGDEREGWRPTEYATGRWGGLAPCPAAHYLGQAS